MFLQQTSINTLIQLTQLIQSLEQYEYKLSLKILSGSSIGNQVRHILEFYTCLINGISTGTIDYDARERDIELETNSETAIKLIEEIINYIQNLKNDQVLNLKVVLANDDNFITIPTNFYRELAYNIEHCIHHLAIIKIGVTNNFHTVNLPENFGIAYSTIRFKEKNNFETV